MLSRASSGEDMRPPFKPSVGRFLVHCANVLLNWIEFCIMIDGRVPCVAGDPRPGAAAVAVAVAG